ncbi:MAG: restriction endonuclease subunit S [Verrucomicrobiota bacterium]
MGEIVANDRGLVQTGPFGSQLHQSDYTEEGTPLIMPTNISDGRVSVDGIARVSEETADRMARHKLKPRTIVLPRRGEITKRAFIREDQEDWLCGSGCLKIEVHDTEVVPEYLYYFMATHETGQWLEQHAVGSTMLNLSAGIVNEMPVLYPSKKVQGRIAETLIAYDDLIENNRRRMVLFEESARLLYREWFVRLRFPGHEHSRIVSGVPEGWRGRMLEEVCENGNGIHGIQTGPFGSQLHQSDYSDEGVPVVMPKDLIGFRIVTEGIARIPETLADSLGRHRMMYGDTVYGRRCDIGRRAFISKRQVGWFCGTGCLRIRPDPKEVNPRYLFDTLGTSETAGTIANRAKGATMLNLNGRVLQSVPVTIASRQLQELYAQQIESIDELIETLALQNQKLRTARDLLLPKLMSGAIEV